MLKTTYASPSRSVSRIAVLGIVGILLLGLGAGCMSTNIDSGQGGVMYSIFGGTKLDKVFSEGLKMHAPWTTIYTYDLRVQEHLEEITALSNNGLSIAVDMSIRWRPQAGQLPRLHVTYGRDYATKLLIPELRSAAREVVGQFTPEELYSTRRSELQTAILERVQRRVQGRYVEVESVLIRNVTLPDQIRKAIESKLTEEQEVQRYKFTLQKDSLEAARKQIEARGQAEYQRIVTQSLSPEFLRFKGIEATERLAESANAKTVIIGGKDGLPIILGGQ